MVPEEFYIHKHLLTKTLVSSLVAPLIMGLCNLLASNLQIWMNECRYATGVIFPYSLLPA